MATGIERRGLFEATGPRTPGERAITVAWLSVAFVHWAYDPAAVARLLPAGISADLYGGMAWAGYRFTTVSPGWRMPDGTPRRPHGLGRARVGIQRRDVRAVVAVVGPDGVPGLWCLSVDTNSRMIAAGLRRWLNLPAYQAETRYAATDDRVEYWTQRPDGTTARLKLTVGSAITPTDVDRFLTARWRIVLPPRWWDEPAVHRAVTIAHPPWRLHRASTDFFDDDVIVAAGLPPAVGPAQALWSPGAAVELGVSCNGG